MEEIGFSIDAGLINRLGVELVGRAETAVSELIKNAYDADSTLVELYFIDSNQIGGSLEIRDNGSGMNREQLVNGFMRISSYDKVDNPISPIFGRSRAGKKGIGRFATQRLGKRLILTTQTSQETKAVQIIIDWDKYLTHDELNTILHPINEVSKERESGTTLRIENLREAWTESTIKRIFRHTSELIQPNYLTESGKNLSLSTSGDNSFEIVFYQVLKNEVKIVADVDKLIFEFAIATIEGYVGNDGIGYCSISSKRFDLNEIHEISADPEEEFVVVPYKKLNNIHYKAYYFIYQRPDYYDDSVPRILLHQISEFSKEKSGLRVYRNGFRVLPYGEVDNDWLNIDKRYGSISGAINIPFGNKNLFGFIEIIDQKGKNFEETASREGLIENDAFTELVNFMHRSLAKARSVIAASIEFKKARSSWVEKQKDSRNIQQKIDDFGRNIEKISKDLKESLLTSNANAINDSKTKIENHLLELKSIGSELTSIKLDITSKIEELALMRVLAGLGLTIAIFVHELQQFTPSFQGNINYLIHQKFSRDIMEVIMDMQKSFMRFETYTSYFDKTISRNVQRELVPINIKTTVIEFLRVVESDAINSGIRLEKDLQDFEILTRPMHPSEWSSLLFNLYTNSKKAIRRAKVRGRIMIAVRHVSDKILVDFMDNGDGIPAENQNRIFDAFYTTSQANINGSGGDLTGTGLGLKIVKDIINAYNGEIFVSEPIAGFSTCIQIEIRAANKMELDNYGY